MKIDLNASASEGFKSQPIEELKDATETAATEVSQTESGEEGTGASTQESEVARVPYSRVERITRQREEAEARAADAEERYQQLLQSRQPEQRAGTTDESDPLYNQIVRLYGNAADDNAVAKEIYRIQKDQLSTMEERAYQRALEATRESRFAESREETQNLDTIDARLDDLADALGRELTPKEEEALLDIVDEYTPKDKGGNYLGGDTISFEKAYEIYELQQASAGASSKRARSAATGASSARSSGEPTLEAQKEKDKNFDPSRGFGQWRNRFSNN